MRTSFVHFSRKVGKNILILVFKSLKSMLFIFLVGSCMLDADSSISVSIILYISNSRFVSLLYTNFPKLV